MFFALVYFQLPSCWCSDDIKTRANDAKTQIFCQLRHTLPTWLSLLWTTWHWQVELQRSPGGLSWMRHLSYCPGFWRH